MEKFNNLYNKLKSSLVISEAVNVPLLQKIINANHAERSARNDASLANYINSRFNSILYTLFYDKEIIDHAEYNTLNNAIPEISKIIFDRIKTNKENITKLEAFKLLVNSIDTFDENKKEELINAYANTDQKVWGKYIANPDDFKNNFKLDSEIVNFFQNIDAGNITYDDLLILDRKQLQENFRKAGKITYSTVYAFTAGLKYIGFVKFEKSGKIIGTSSYIKNYKELVETGDIFICITRTNIDNAVGKHYERSQNKNYLKQDDPLQRRQNKMRYGAKLWDRQRNRSGLDLQKNYQEVTDYVKTIAKKIRQYMIDNDLGPLDFDNNLVKEYHKLVKDYKDLYNIYGNGSNLENFIGKESTWAKKIFDSLKDQANELEQKLSKEE